MAYDDSVRISIALLLAACGSSGTATDAGFVTTDSTAAGVPSPGRILATFTFDSPVGYSGATDPMTDEPTHVVLGTDLANGVAISYGDSNHTPTRELTIPLMTSSPLVDGLVIPLGPSAFSYTENNATPQSAEWRNDGSQGLVVGHVDGQIFTFALHTPMRASAGGAGTFTLNGSGAINLCATDPQCFAH